MEARNYTITHLNRLMFPAIFITAICSVLQVPLENIELFNTATNGTTESKHSISYAFLLSIASAFVAFLLSIIIRFPSLLMPGESATRTRARS